MRRRPAQVLGVALLLAVALVASACAGAGGPAVRKVTPAEAVGLLSSRVVIDVRTPSEYAAGHIEGAQNIDVEAPDFATQLSSLDEHGKYLVYCHSGRRSALAADTMAKAGFTDIVDAGAMPDLLKAGATTQ